MQSSLYNIISRKYYTKQSFVFDFNYFINFVKILLKYSKILKFS